jgi:hypothetical protein
VAGAKTSARVVLEGCKGDTIGNLVDRAVIFASFVFGGVMDACPDLKICLAYGGGYTCYGIGRMDRGWQPRGPHQTEVRRWYLVDIEAPLEVRDFLRQYYMRYAGPGGLTEQDDDNFGQHQRSDIEGHFTRLPSLAALW